MARTKRADQAPFDDVCANGLFTWQAGNYRLRLAEREALPGIDDLSVSSIEDTFVNNAGDIAFTGLTRASDSSELYSSAWVMRASGSQLQLLAIEGERQGDATFDNAVSNLYGGTPAAAAGSRHTPVPTHGCSCAAARAAATR